MNRPSRLADVGAPSPEARTSPILEESDYEFTVLMQTQEGRMHCYFNNMPYDNGSYICSGSGEQLRCEKGVWIREGGCDSANP